MEDTYFFYLLCILMLFPVNEPNQQFSLTMMILIEMNEDSNKGHFGSVFSQPIPCYSYTG